MASRLVLPGLLGAVLDMTCSKLSMGGGADGECIEQGHKMPRRLIQSLFALTGVSSLREAWVS